MSDREAIFDYIEADNSRAAAIVDDRIEAQVEGLIPTPPWDGLAESREHANWFYPEPYT